MTSQGEYQKLHFPPPSFNRSFIFLTAKIKIRTKTSINKYNFKQGINVQFYK